MKVWWQSSKPTEYRLSISFAGGRVGECFTSFRARPVRGMYNGRCSTAGVVACSGGAAFRSRSKIVRLSTQSALPRPQSRLAVRLVIYGFSEFLGLRMRTECLE